MSVLVALRRTPAWTLPLVLAVVLVALPQLGAGFIAQRQIVLICILALLVSGLNLSLGYAGELALGGAAVYAVGAYVSGFLSLHGHTDILLQLAASATAALLIGLLTGVPGLRLGGWSLAMTSFFLILLVPDVISIFEEETGGNVGMVGIAMPTMFGRPLGQEGYYLVVTVVTVLWFIVMRNLVTSRHGIAFRVLKQNPVLAASTGISVYRLKLTAYALGGIPAGLAGALFANLDLYISPLTFSFALAVSILAASILGGATSVYGAVIGAAIMQLGPLKSTEFQEYALVVYGVILIVGGVLFAEGIVGLLRRGVRIVRPPVLAWLGRRGLLTMRATGPDLGSDEVPLAPIPGASLQVVGISKRFSGLQALSDVSLTAPAGQVTALIGPNGSGKTTLLNVISGFYRADAGTVVIDGVTPRPRPHLVAREGVARTFQTPIVPAGLTVLEAVVSGRYMTQYRSLVSAVLRLPAYRKVSVEDRSQAMEVLQAVGIADLAGSDASALPLGTRRLLEVARALIARPKLVLLDEAASGLDETEVDKLGQLIRRIRDAGGTVILVEHNFRLVLSLADTVFVLAQGKIIASGPPAAIEANPAVLREYLGIDSDDDPSATPSVSLPEATR